MTYILNIEAGYRKIANGEIADISIPFLRMDIGVSGRVDKKPARDIEECLGRLPLYYHRENYTYKITTGARETYAYANTVNPGSGYGEALRIYGKSQELGEFVNNVSNPPAFTPQCAEELAARLVAALSQKLDPLNRQPLQVNLKHGDDFNYHLFQQKLAENKLGNAGRVRINNIDLS